MAKPKIITGKSPQRPGINVNIIYGEEVTLEDVDKLYKRIIEVYGNKVEPQVLLGMIAGELGLRGISFEEYTGGCIVSGILTTEIITSVSSYINE